MENRNGALAGTTSTLRVIFLDAGGNLVDCDTEPTVYIYSPSVEEETIINEVDSETYVSATASIASTRIATGFYEITFTSATNAEDGLWKDIWVGLLNGVKVFNANYFTIYSAVSFNHQSISTNELIVVSLSEELASLAPEPKMLKGGFDFSFMTKLDPYYASVDLVRMEAGPLIEYIPDDTLALMIHWASKEADAISPRKRCPKEYNFWRTKFIVFDVALKAVTLPGGHYVNGFTSGFGDSKSLGDLKISKGYGPVLKSMSGGVDQETYKNMKKSRDEIWRVVNAGGCINPGQSLGFEIALKGIYDKDRRIAGRLWHDPDDVHYSQYGVNSKFRAPGARSSRFGFARTSEGRLWRFRN